MHLKELFQGDTEFFGTSNLTFSGFDRNVERSNFSTDSSQKENIEHFRSLKTHIFTRNVNYTEY